MASGQSSSNGGLLGSASSFSYFCHQCSSRSSIRQVDFTCVTCGSGFIEEVVDEQVGEDISAAAAAAMPVAGEIFDQILPTVIASLAGANRMPTSSTLRSDRLVPRDHAVRSFITDPAMQSLLSGLHMVAGPGVMFPIYVNLGDYAWGQGDLDAIVTTLLNQMEVVGPAPMQSEAINQIPTVKVSSNQVESNLQCSVCWDDFTLDETVRQLSCDHIFHDGCIVPWLKLHATCPVCRKELQDNRQAFRGDSDGPSTVPAPQIASSIGDQISTVINQIFSLPSPLSSASTSQGRVVPGTQHSSAAAAPDSEERDQNRGLSSERDDQVNEYFEDFDLE